MIHRSRRIGLCLSLALILEGWIYGQVLFDASLNTLPSSQSWAFAAFKSSEGPALTNNSVYLDTTSSALAFAGHARNAPAALNRRFGFALQFCLQLQSEIHMSIHRAGFSLIVLDQDHRGIELGFWTNCIFAQTDAPLFNQGETINYDTTAEMVDYMLVIGPTNYSLHAGTQPLLSGPVRDYSAFDGIPDPYGIPNFLFFGDNTSSAAAAASVRRIILIAPPRLALTQPGTLTWTGISGQTYAVESSSDLRSWSTLGLATSLTDDFVLLDPQPSNLRFYRAHLRLPQDPSKIRLSPQRSSGRLRERL